MKKWGFIYTLGDTEAELRIDRLGSPECEFVCIGIATAEDGPRAARRLLDDGVELIELCGAFAGRGLAAILQEVDDRVPVGAVFYGGEAASGLHRLFS